MSKVLRIAVFAVAVAIAAAGCGKKQDTAPAVVTAQVTLSRPKVALGSPVEVTYKFTVAANAPALGARKVFVHFLDADEELMWTDDHDPATPTTEWKPGQTIEYTRTMFVPSYPYVGAAKIVAGLYTPGSNDRLKLSNEDRGGPVLQGRRLRVDAADREHLRDLQGRLASGGSGGRRRDAHGMAVDQEGSDARVPQPEARRHLVPAGR